MVHKKELKIKGIIFLLICILLLNICFVISQETSTSTSKKPYNIDDTETWYSSQDNFVEFKADLSDSAKLKQINSKMSSLSDSQREYVFKRMLTYYPNLDKISVKGLGGKDLIFSQSKEGQMIIGDGKVSLNSNKKLPGWVAEVEYVSVKGLTSSFVYKDKSGAEIALYKGSINEQGFFVDVDKDGKSVVTDVKLLPEKDSKITALGSGVFVLEKGGKLSISGKEFSLNNIDKQGMLQVTGKNTYLASNMIVDSGNLLIKTQDATAVVFGGKEIQVAGQYVKIDNEKIDMVGKNIELELKKDSAVAYKVTAEGNGLIVKNEKVNYEINGGETKLTRNIGNYKDLHAFELKNMQSADKLVYTNKYIEGTAVAGEIKPVVAETKPTTESKPAETKPAPSGVAVADAKTGKIFVQIGDEQSMQQSAALGLVITDAMKSKFGIEKSTFENMPQNMNDEQFQKWLVGVDKKMEVTPVLDLGAAKLLLSKRGKGRNQLDGRDLYDGFMAGPPEMKTVPGKLWGTNTVKVDPTAPDEPGKLYTWGQQGLVFPADEKTALDSMLKTALTDDSGNWRKFPPGSKFYVSSGTNPQIRILENKGTLAQPNLVEVYSKTITDPTQVKALNRNFEYGLTFQDEELKTSTKGKYTRSIDRVQDTIKSGKCNRNVCF